MAYKLGFDFINNMIKYEALILEMKVALILKIKNLEIYGYYKLIINQVNDVYNTKDEKLQPYKIFINDLLEEFDIYNIQNVSRTNNRYADAMASVASLVSIDIEDEEILLTIKKLGTPP